MKKIFAVALAVFGCAASALAADPPQQPRPYTLTAPQAQDYVNYLQNVMRDAEQRYQAAKATFDDLAKQASEQAKPQPSPETPKK